MIRQTASRTQAFSANRDGWLAVWRHLESGATRGLPFGGCPDTFRYMVIAHHLILTGYGHWLPNDPRGSLSREIRAGKLFPLGDIRFGRQTPQPSRQEVSVFHEAAQEKLEHPVLWFDAAKRRVVAEAFARVLRSRRYTCYACAILPNHAHLVIRRHRDRAETMIRELKQCSAASLCARTDVPEDHPIWSSDPFKRFLDSAEAVRCAIAYVRENPRKSGIATQRYDFVKPYAGEWSGRRS